MAKQTKGFTTHEKRFLASLIRQVWRACQGFVAVVVERGPAEALYALEDLVEWSAAQSARVRAMTGRTSAVGPEARHVAVELLRDVRTFANGIGDQLGDAHQSSLDPDEVEDEALAIIEGFINWTTLMASQLGLSRSLRPHTLWNGR